MLSSVSESWFSLTCSFLLFAPLLACGGWRGGKDLGNGSFVSNSILGMLPIMPSSSGRVFVRQRAWGWGSSLSENSFGSVCLQFLRTVFCFEKH